MIRKLMSGHMIADHSSCTQAGFKSILLQIPRRHISAFAHCTHSMQLDSSLFILLQFTHSLSQLIHRNIDHFHISSLLNWIRFRFMRLPHIQYMHSLLPVGSIHNVLPIGQLEQSITNIHAELANNINRTTSTAMSRSIAQLRVRQIIDCRVHLNKRRDRINHFDHTFSASTLCAEYFTIRFIKDQLQMQLLGMWIEISMMARMRVHNAHVLLLSSRQFVHKLNHFRAQSRRSDHFAKYIANR
mmetsp:Transcript_43110/g.69100  ORF Transcript_43110/g.69100 Transcript_43110/m.69100 type:complete len:243 (+) Transcript_43110:78-806(+)